MLKNNNFRIHLGLLLVAGLAAATYSSPLMSRRERSAGGEKLIPTSETVSTYSEPQYTLSQFIPTQKTYLYGQSHLPEQIGKEYLVFQVERDRVVGAVYYPRSEFACFYGNLTSEKMNLRVIDPYDRNISPYSIPLTAAPVANSPISLAGYQRIQNISDNDRRILNTCLEDNLVGNWN